MFFKVFESEQISGENIVVHKSSIEPRVPNKLFHPNDSYVFPKKVFGKQNRFCNSKWLKLYRGGMIEKEIKLFFLSEFSIYLS